MSRRSTDTAYDSPARPRGRSDAGFFNGATGYTALPGYLLGWSGVADTALLLEDPDGLLAAPVTLSVDPQRVSSRSPGQVDTKVGA